MAEANITVSVEHAVHKALIEAVQKIESEFGIRVNSAHFDWIEGGTVARDSAIVQSIRLDTSMPASAA